MTHGSLFSGIGGFDLAAEWMGWTNLFNCEINSFCRKILKYHFPDAKQYTDIRTVDFTVWRGRIDVLSGGFPCQPFSVAGKRKGTDDNRYLWTEMLRAIREIQPSWIVGENVAGILSMVQPGSEVAVAREESLFGKVDRERVLHRQEYVVETICRDLEREGYSVQPLLIPACAVGAPHRRDRVWFVADTDDKGLEGRADHGILQKEGEEPSAMHPSRFLRPVWKEFPTQSPICCRDDGFPAGLDGITFPKWRNESIMGFGNAVVPQVVVKLFKVISIMNENQYHHQ